MVVRIYRAILDEDKEQVLWPEVRPWKWLQNLKLTMVDSYFDLQYNNDASGMLGGRYKEEWMQFEDISLIEYSSLHGMMYIDPATSIQSHADYFSIAIGGLTNLGDLTILDCEYDKVSPADHNEFILSTAHKWRRKGLDFAYCWIEETGPQQGTTERIIHDLRQDLPIEAHKVTKNSGNKKLRIDKCMGFVKSGQTKFLGYYPPNAQTLVLVPTTGLTELRKEYLTFPRGKDDVLDSVAGLITKALESPPPISVTDNPSEMIRKRDANNPFEREIIRTKLGDLGSQIRGNSRKRLFEKGRNRRGIFR